MLIELIPWFMVGLSFGVIAVMEWRSFQMHAATRGQLQRLEYPPGQKIKIPKVNMPSWETFLRVAKSESQAGAPRPTTTPVSPEARSGVAAAPTGLGSPALRSLNQTLDSLQALGEQARRVVSHAELFSKPQALPELYLSESKMLAQAVVALASTSLKQATRVSVASEQARAISGSKSSSGHRVVGSAPIGDGNSITWGFGRDGGAWWREDVAPDELSAPPERIKTYPVAEPIAVRPDGPSREMNEY